MNPIIQLGSLSLNGTVVAFLISYILVTGVLKYVSVFQQLHEEWLRSLLDSSIVAGLIGARLFFAAQYWQSYIDTPWTVLYFWQPGYSLAGSALSVVAFSIYKFWREKPDQFRKHLIAATSIFASMGLLVALLLVFITLDSPDKPNSISTLLTEPRQFQNQRRETLTTEMLHGRPVVLNFWATWCPPCRREMPLLNEAAMYYADSELMMIAVNVGEPYADVSAYLEEKKFSLPVWIDELSSTQQLFNDLNGQVMPTTLFISTDGEIMQTRVGELSAATLQQGIDKIFPGH